MLWQKEKILEVRDLSISFTTTGGEAEMPSGVDLDVYRGETVAIVGESGSQIRHGKGRHGHHGQRMPA